MFRAALAVRCGECYLHSDKRPYLRISYYAAKILHNKKIRFSALIGCFIALCGSVIIGAGDFQISGKALFGDIIAFVAAGVISLYFFVQDQMSFHR